MYLSLGRLLGCLGLLWNTHIQHIQQLFLDKVSSCHCIHRTISKQKLLDQPGHDTGGKIGSCHHGSSFLWGRLCMVSDQRPNRSSSPALPLLDSEPGYGTGGWKGLLFLTVLDFLWLRNNSGVHHFFLFISREGKGTVHTSQNSMY